MVTVGQTVEDFTAQATPDRTLSLNEHRGQQVVLYFYPKDHTPGCTREGQDFRDEHAAFAAADTVIYGVSRDSLRTHQNFINKHDFPFDLISDPEEALCRQFDVIKEKKLYGKTHMGIERSTFLIGRDGTLVDAWRKVKVPGHVHEVLERARANAR